MYSLDMNGIKRKMSALRTPQHNGIEKRRNRKIVDIARTMLMQGNVANMSGEKS